MIRGLGSASRDEWKIMYDCNLCGGPYQMGPHRYEGHHLRHYQMWLCDQCFQGSHDGIGPVFEPFFERHLREHNIAIPKRDSKGRYPR
jgi:hypothetical protein